MCYKNSAAGRVFKSEMRQKLADVEDFYSQLVRKREQCDVMQELLAEHFDTCIKGLLSPLLSLAIASSDRLTINDPVYSVAINDGQIHVSEQGKRLEVLGDTQINYVVSLLTNMTSELMRTFQPKPDARCIVTSGVHE